MLNGRIGQVLGPFDADVDLLDDGQPIGNFTPETTRPILLKLGIQALEECKADEDTIVDFVY